MSIVAVLSNGKECGDNYICRFQQSCGKTYHKEDYITNGQDVAPDEFPSFARIFVITDTGTWPRIEECSGVIVSDYHILTAGHCVEESSQEPIIYRSAHVFVGTNKKDNSLSTPLRVHSICSHPKIIFGNNSLIMYDMAILTLKEPLKFDKHIQPACWPFEPEKIDAGDNSVCYQVGAGDTLNVRPDEPGLNKKLIQKLRVKEIDCPKGELLAGKACMRAHESNASGSVCHGDSGGPTLCLDKKSNRWYVVGSASFVVPDFISEISCPDGSVFIAAVPDNDAMGLSSTNCKPPSVGLQHET